MNWIRQRVLSGELMTGTWLNLGSSMTAEIAGRAGFDWVVLDLEHGAGDHDSLVHQLQAVSATPAAPIVRVAWNEAPRFKRVLDLGAAGVVVPYVTSAEEAKAAAAAMRYPPQGVRGVAGMNRACDFGDFDTYAARANDELLTIVQIECQPALASLDAIAAVEGVDVLFVGPMDLSFSLGIPQQYDHPRFRAALEQVANTARAAAKAAGILLMRPDQVEGMLSLGFTFVGLGSDGGILAKGMRETAALLQKHRK